MYRARFVSNPWREAIEEYSIASLQGLETNLALYIIFTSYQLQ